MTTIVFISTDADPVAGTPLISAADGQRHHEIFRGTTAAGGKTWNWLPVTANSTMDNLRPLIPAWPGKTTALIWMRGAYKNNRGEWTSQVVADLLTPEDFSR